MSLGTAHTDNRPRWNPGVRTGMYESHFLKLNLPEQQAAFWCRYTVLHPLPGMGAAAFEVWAIFFDVAEPARSCAAKATFGPEQARVGRDLLQLSFGDNHFEHEHATGSIGDDPQIRWDLRWATRTALRHFPLAQMYDAPFPKAKLTSPALDAAFTGTIRIGDRELTVDGHPGMQGHNWGEKHADSWVWAHCNAFEEQGVVFEGVSSRLRMGPVAPQLTILHLDDGTGHPLTINGWTEMMRTDSEVEGLRWRFRGSHADRGVEGVIHAPAERFVGLYYSDPDGQLTHCLNSKIADAELRMLRREGGRWRLDRLLTARASAALEIGVKDDPRGVRMHL